MYRTLARGSSTPYFLLLLNLSSCSINFFTISFFSNARLYACLYIKDFCLLRPHFRAFHGRHWGELVITGQAQRKYETFFDTFACFQHVELRPKPKLVWCCHRVAVYGLATGFFLKELLCLQIYIDALRNHDNLWSNASRLGKCSAIH